MAALAELIALLIAVVSLCVFICGLVLAIFELTSVAPAVISVALGIFGLFVAWTVWLLEPSLSAFFGAANSKARDVASSAAPLVFYPVNKSIDGSKKDEKDSKEPFSINVDSTETLMRSIRGIPYLIQAIQYSLETTIMSELNGRSAVNTSVIHTAPGCHSVLDCDSEEEQSHCGCNGGGSLTVGDSLSMSKRNAGTAHIFRLSGPEESWEEESSKRNYWVNQHLKLSMMNREYNSSLAVFPYSESRPINKSDSTEDPINLGEHSATSPEGIHQLEGDEIAMQRSGGSIQSSLSRVTVAHHTDSNSQHEIRCIGMSSAFLSRFNNSFRT
ncbi:hypothetical protein Ddc_05287 [Ditylenchus destructor]|nr:hypothetical protein Ddc_05287 [Ditylenchus destructor]